MITDSFCISYSIQKEHICNTNINIVLLTWMEKINWYLTSNMTESLILLSVVKTVKSTLHTGGLSMTMVFSFPWKTLVGYYTFSVASLVKP